MGFTVTSLPTMAKLKYSLSGQRACRQRELRAALELSVIARKYDLNLANEADCHPSPSTHARLPSVVVSRRMASLNWLFGTCPDTFLTTLIAQAVNRWNISQPQRLVALEKG